MIIVPRPPSLHDTLRSLHAPARERFKIFKEHFPNRLTDFWYGWPSWIMGALMSATMGALGIFEYSNRRIAIFAYDALALEFAALVLCMTASTVEIFVQSFRYLMKSEDVAAHMHAVIDRSVAEMRGSPHLRSLRLGYYVRLGLLPVPAVTAAHALGFLIAKHVVTIPQLIMWAHQNSTGWAYVGFLVGVFYLAGAVTAGCEWLGKVSLLTAAIGDDGGPQQLLSAFVSGK
jgi:hypothetical protein